MLRSISVAAILLASATPAFAQRANENAVKAAGDAFGTSYAVRLAVALLGGRAGVVQLGAVDCLLIRDARTRRDGLALRFKAPLHPFARA